MFFLFLFLLLSSSLSFSLSLSLFSSSTLAGLARLDSTLASISHNTHIYINILYLFVKNKKIFIIIQKYNTYMIFIDSFSSFFFILLLFFSLFLFFSNRVLIKFDFSPFDKREQRAETQQ